MKNNKIISILSVISIMTASFINVPVFAEDTPIINSEQISFNFNINDGGDKNGKFATVSYRPKNHSFPGFTSYSASPLAYEWGVFSGSKLVFDISGLGDNVEFIDRVTLTPNGYVRDYIKSFNTAEEAAGFDAYYEQVNGETTVYRPISYTLKTMLVDSTPYPNTTLADMKYEEIKNEDNTKTFVNTMLNETENTVWPDSPYYQEPLGTMTYNYTDEQINYFKAGNLKKSLFDFGSVDITENIIPKILNGDETAAYTLWLDPDEYNICISVEPRSYTVDVSYITESKFLEKLTTSDNTAAYLDFVLSDSEMELYNGLSAESQSEVLAEVKSTGYGSMNEFTAAVKNAVNAKIDKELLAEIKAAMSKEDKSELDAYIIQALGKDDNLYQKFKLINDKETAAYSKIAAAESYEAFVSIVRTAIKEYSESAEKSEIDNYTYTLTNSWTNPENTHLKYNTNNGTVAYGNGSGIVGYNYGKEGARLTFNTEFISHPEMIKSAVVRLKTVTRDYSVKDRDVRLYLVPLGDNNNDADAFNGTIEDKFYSDDYGVYGDEAAPNNGKTVVLNMDVTDDIKEKLSSGKTDVSYVIASTSDNWSLGTLWLDERYATITMTVTYYNDYDFGRNHTDNVKAAIGYACGFDYESMYDALADKTAVDIRAKADYDTIASFKETIVPMVKEAYFEQIIKNGVTDEVIKNVFGVYSTEYDKYRSIIDKAQAVEGMEYSDYESF
ncbi:MAG: hypothetical protein SOZ34_10295, partial [Clostridia bacterium]|nr:hypothetical protein [Clostridia bacterium]